MSVQNYTPLSIHTHYSLLRGFSKPEELVKRAVELNIGSLAITDFDKVSGSVSFYKECVDAGIKPLLGSKLFIKDDNGYVTAIARNMAGWKELIHLSSLSHDIGHFDTNPTLAFSDLQQSKNLIIISGEPESTLCRAILARDVGYLTKTPESLLSYYLHSDYSDRVTEQLSRYKDAFGENFFVSIQRMNQSTCPIDKIIADILSEESKAHSIKSIAVPNCYYTSKENSTDHKLLQCIHNGISWSSIQASVDKENNAKLARFFKSDDNNCHLPYESEMTGLYSELELENTNLISDMCEPYSILDNPSLPKFQCPDGMSEKEYLRELCRAGWQRLTPKLDLSRTKEYVDRVNNELSVFTEANLEGYFLIVQDYVKWAKNQGMLVGASRGSAGGCLVSYLTDIITIDPIIYELYFERFYNKGRNSPGKISYPDIDVDFPAYGRESVIKYISDKYGSENVSQVATFSSLQGRGAIKEVFRVHDACTQQTMNEITKRIPQKAEIEDKLEATNEKSIIRWTLQNDPDALGDWCRIEDDKLTGAMASYFEQAIRIEGTYKSYGKHASALIIGSKPVSTVCPMINDKKTGKLIAGVEYEGGLSDMGLTKFDVLSTSVLDKLMGVNQLLLTGKLKDYSEIEQVEESDD